jgi:hypothetical protein
LAIGLICHTFKQAPSYASIDFAREMEKLSVTKFSVVGIRLEAMGHIYGATLFHLLRALSVHGVTKILKVNLVRSKKSEVTTYVPYTSGNCSRPFYHMYSLLRACKNRCPTGFRKKIDILCYIFVINTTYVL